MEKEEELNAQGKIEKNDKGKDMLEAKTFTDPIKILDLEISPKQNTNQKMLLMTETNLLGRIFGTKIIKLKTATLL